MKKNEIIIASVVGVVGFTALYLLFFGKKKPTETTPIKKNAVNIPQREFIIKDRYKFLDEWIAEEGGADSIRAMYKKRPSAFPPSDVAYLKSKGVLAGDELKGRGLTIQTII